MEPGSLRWGRASEIPSAAATEGLFWVIPGKDSAGGLGYLLTTAQKLLGNSECQELSVLCSSFFSDFLKTFFNINKLKHLLVSLRQNDHG